MVADIFELNRWHAHFLGANTPVEDLILMIQAKEPDVVALSVAISSNLPRVAEVIERVRAEQLEMPILLGGQAFKQADHDAFLRFPNVHILSQLQELEDFIRDFANAS